MSSINKAMTSSSVISSFVAASALNVFMVEFLFLLKILNNKSASKISRQAVISLYFFIGPHAFYYYIYTTPIFNIPLTSTAYYHAKLHTITETHIQTRKLRAVSVFVLYLPFIDSIFRQANTPFSQNRQYLTPFYLSVLYYHGNP